MTNPFSESEPQYHKSQVVPLGQPSDDTNKLIKASWHGLRQIDRPGYRYKKTGVLLMALQPKLSVQPTLFDEPEEQVKTDHLMQIMDRINQKMGKGTLTIAASGTNKRWAMRRESKSPNYTTEWSELPEAW